MHQEASLGYLVADAGRARLLLRHGDGRYTDLAKLDAAPHARPKHDTRGRVFGSVGSARSAVPEPTPDPGADVFAAEVAEEVEGYLRRGAFERLVVVAPARMLARLRPRLDRAGHAVVGEHAKDLTKLPEAKLRETLDALLLEAGGRGD